MVQVVLFAVECVLHRARMRPERSRLHGRLVLVRAHLETLPTDRVELPALVVDPRGHDEQHAQAVRHLCRCTWEIVRFISGVVNGGLTTKKPARSSA